MKNYPEQFLRAEICYINVGNNKKSYKNVGFNSVMKYYRWICLFLNHFQFNNTIYNIIFVSSFIGTSLILLSFSIILRKFKKNLEKIENFCFKETSKQKIEVSLIFGGTIVIPITIFAFLEYLRLSFAIYFLLLVLFTIGIYLIITSFRLLLHRKLGSIIKRSGQGL